jgi:hypothetical protein
MMYNDYMLMWQILSHDIEVFLLYESPDEKKLYNTYKYVSPFTTSTQVFAWMIIIRIQFCRT